MTLAARNLFNDRITSPKPYPSYKDSGIEWLGSIPSHWSLRRLKNAMQIDSNKLVEKPDDLPYLGLESVESKTGKMVTDGLLNEIDSGVGLFSKGDLLFGKLRPYLAKVLVAPFDGTCTTELLILKPSLSADSYFMGYQLLSPWFIHLVNSFTYGAKMPRANSQQIGNVKVVLPPIPEQHSIISYLNRETAKIDSLIAKKQRLIELLNEKRAAIISHAVTKGLDPTVPMKNSGIEWLGEIPKHWPTAKLSRLTTRIGDGLHGTPEYVEESEYRFVNGNNLLNGSVNMGAQVRCVSEHEFRKHKIALDESTLLMSINGTIGNVAFYRGESIILSKSAAYIKCGNDLSRSYLFFLLQSATVRDFLQIEATGTTILNLSLESIRNLAVAVPPLDEQQEISSFLEMKMARLNDVMEKALGAINVLHEYRTAFISAAVTGKIDVRNHVPQKTEIELDQIMEESG